MKLKHAFIRAVRKGFSLIELMVAMGILSVLMLMLTVVLDQVQEAWTYSESRISQFREARLAFDLVAKNLGQASLNTYWDLKDEDEDGLVDGYFATSELHFTVKRAEDINANSSQQPVGHAVFFQAPLGFSNEYRNLTNLFNGRGYFVAWGSDRRFRPGWVRSSERYRYRLMEFRPPAESNQVFEDGAEERSQKQPQEFTEWFKHGLSVGEGDFESHLNPLAENIITMIISPRDSLQGGSGSRDETLSDIAPNYTYDSNEPEDGVGGILQQVPPLVRLTMIAIDDSTMARLGESTSPPTEIGPLVEKAPESTRNYEADIAQIVRGLDEAKISHKVFSTMVLLRSAKWSDPVDS